MKVSWPASRDVALWCSAHAVARVEAYAFDYFLYPYMLYSGGGVLIGALTGAPAAENAGYWTGFVLLTTASLILNLLYVRLYDRSRRDWFGFERLRAIPINRRLRGASLLRPVGRAGSFIYLAVWHSPLFAVLWGRSHESEFEMTRADWVLFGAAVLVSNIGWTVVVTAAAEFVQLALNMAGHA